MLDVEMWAIKDVKRNILVISKWGRSTWKRKTHPDSVNIVGYYKHKWVANVREECPEYKNLKPIKIKVTEIEEDK